MEYGSIANHTPPVSRTSGFLNQGGHGIELFTREGSGFGGHVGGEDDARSAVLSLGHLRVRLTGISKYLSMPEFDIDEVLLATAHV
jgi:hypothetical protein